MRYAPVAPEEMVEKDWQRLIVDLAVQVGWGKAYHVFDSRRSHSGFPDLILVRERILYAELKRQTTGPTPDQVEWLDRLARAGGEVYLWRPRDLDEVSRILTTRWEPAARGTGRNPTGLWTMRDGYWQPRSMWLPKQGRRDTTANEQQSLLTEGAA